MSEVLSGERRRGKERGGGRGEKRGGEERGGEKGEGRGEGGRRNLFWG